MTALPASWHAPLVVTRARYGDELLAATEPIVVAAHGRDPYALQAAIDHALTTPQPVGEDPVVWLVTALAAQIDPTVPLPQRLPWTPDVAPCP